MWKYFITTDNVFWDNATINKPDSSYINNLNWIETNINVDMQNINKISFYSTIDGIRLLKVVNTTTNKVLYYYFERVLKYVKNNYLLEFTLDYWCTYTLNLIKQDVNVLAERHQDYTDFKCLEFDDPVLNDLELNFDNYEFPRTQYENDNGTYYSNVIGRQLTYTDPKDIINANYCLVLSDSDEKTQSFTFIPVLTYNSTVNVQNFNNDDVFNNVYGTIYQDSEGKFNPNYKRSLKFTFSNDFVSWYNQSIQDGYKFAMNLTVGADTNHTISWNLTDALFGYDLAQCEVRLHHISNYIALVIIYQGREIYNNTQWTSGAPSGNWFNMNYLRFDGKKSSTLEESKIVNNSMNAILKLARGKQSNKVNGIYMIPNVLSIANLWTTKNIDSLDYLTLSLPQQGTKINKMLISTGYTTAELKFDSLVPVHKIVYKFFESNWMNNKLDLSKLINDKGDVYFGDYLLFTNSLNIINENQIVPLDNQIYTLPAQQPFNIDTYNNYINANMNTVNTGYQINKQNSIFNGVQQAFNSIFGVIKNSLSGNVAGAVSSATGGIFGVANTALKASQYEKQIRAKYADADNVMGNKLLFGSTEDAIWTQQITKYNDNYHIMQVKRLSLSSIKQVNNTLLLYGVYNPKYLNLSTYESPTNALGFYYLKLNTKDILTQFSSLINESLETKEIIYSQLQEFRVWSKIPQIKNTSN